MAIPTRRRRTTSRSKGSNRDDFRAATVKLLRERAGNVCSNPGCRITTLGPQQGDSGIVITGVAAHISGAAPLGPRYDPSLTKAQRKHYDNGIWLCSGCSTRIDRDKIFYTAKLLQDWKKIAIKAAAARQDTRAFGEQEVTDHLHSALTGFAKGPFVGAIHNIHKAEAAALESLDQRFVVSTSYRDGVAGYELNPRHEPVRLDLSYSPEVAAEIQVKMAALHAWGKQFQVPSLMARVTGSPLIEYLESLQEGVLTLGARGMEAVIKARVLRDGGTVAMETFTGLATAGSVGISVSATAFGGLMGCSFDLPLNADDESRPISTFSHNWAVFEGRDIRHLPYLTDAIEFMKPIVKGATVSLEVSLKGLRAFDAEVDGAPVANYLGGMLALAQYADSCAVLAELLDRTIVFSLPPKPLPWDAVGPVHEAAMIARNGWVVRPPDSPFDLTVPDNVDAIRDLLHDPDHWGELRYVESPRSVMVFGEEIELPNRVAVIDQARLKTNCRPEDLIPGMDIKVALETLPEAKMRIQFANQSLGKADRFLVRGRRSKLPGTG